MTGVQTCALPICANRFPHVDDRSDGFKRRLRVIAMDKKPPKRDLHLEEKLLNELEFWVYMAVIGLKKVMQQNNVYESENSKKIRESIYKDSDSVYAFIADCLVKYENTTFKRADAFREYDKYCSYHERIRVKKKTFFDEMKAKGFITKKDKNGCIVYDNVYYKPFSEEI